MGTDVQEKDRRENGDLRATGPSVSLVNEKISELGRCQLPIGVEGDMMVHRGALKEEQLLHEGKWAGEVPFVQAFVGADAFLVERKSSCSEIRVPMASGRALFRHCYQRWPRTA